MAFIIEKEDQFTLLKDRLLSLPIIDYHSHLSAKDILENRKWESPTEWFLAEDHYKWRVIRTATGEFKPHPKHFTFYHFDKFLDTLELMADNPVKTWFKLELKLIFGIDDFDFKFRSRKDQFNKIKKKLEKDSIIPELLSKFNVETIYTTDDPTGDLEAHSKLKGNISTEVLPTFRVDGIFDFSNMTNWKNYIKKLVERVSFHGWPKNYNELERVLSQSLTRYISIGSRLIDISLPSIHKTRLSFKACGEILNQVLTGEKTTLSENEIKDIQYYLLLVIMRIANSKDMIVQLHLGPIRNVSSSMKSLFGKDIGCDTIGNGLDFEGLGDFLDDVERHFLNQKMIIYNSNPNDLYPLITMVDSFGPNIKIGPPWWFLDNEKMIREFLDAIDSISVLGSFIGMTTDSRSFGALVRHLWFREIVIDHLYYKCSMEEIENICTKIFYKNAKEFIK